MSIFKNPRHSTIYVILSQNVQHSKVTYTALDELVRMSPISIRPKCLLIMQKRNQWPFDDIKKLLNHAWSLKFLDFTVIIVINNSKMVCISFNPFTIVYDTKYSCTMSEVFPGKLQNVNKYHWNE